jgi:hypothetical protein
LHGPLNGVKSHSRVLSGIDALLDLRFSTSFTDWRKNQRISPPPEILCEANRFVEIVMKRLECGDCRQTGNQTSLRR